MTGGTGFVGTNLCDCLKYEYEIIAGDSAMCNLMDKTEVDNFISCIRPDCIIHLAATCGGIGANMASPGRFMNDNLTMGLNLINAAKDAGCVEKFVMMGTICAYPKFTPVPFEEKDMWRGYPEETNAPYGIAKKTLTELLIAYNKEYGMESVNLYPTNMFGPHDDFDPSTSHVIPAIILKVYDAIRAGKDEIELWGAGSATRDFLYVDDCCKAVELALKADPGPEPINIGTGVEVSIKTLTETICTLMQFDGKLLWDASKPDGQPRRCVSSKRAKKLLGYEAKTTIVNGLRTTIDWFLNNDNNRVEK